MKFVPKIFGFLRSGPDIVGVPGRKRGQSETEQQTLSAAEAKRLRKMAKRAKEHLTNAK